MIISNSNLNEAILLNFLNVVHGNQRRLYESNHNFDYSYIKNMCNESSAAGTEIAIQESGGALASGAEEKLPLLF
ncbi:hypothetical protein C0J52_19039 [Blattella germanica]|nr:hypothetical protein C0J52_19039 [Blattella germanica]